MSDFYGSDDDDLGAYGSDDSFAGEYSDDEPLGATAGAAEPEHDVAWCTVFDHAGLAKIEATRIAEVRNILDLHSDVARQLLARHGWDPPAAVEASVERGLQASLRAAGVTGHGAPREPGDVDPADPSDACFQDHLTDATEEQTCGVCFCDVPRAEMRRNRCGHAYCLDCWFGQLRVATSEGRGRRAACMRHKCGALVDPALALAVFEAREPEEARRETEGEGHRGGEQEAEGPGERAGLRGETSGGGKDAGPTEAGGTRSGAGAAGSAGREASGRAGASSGGSEAPLDEASSGSASEPPAAPLLGASDARFGGLFSVLRGMSASRAGRPAGDAALTAAAAARDEAQAFSLPPRRPHRGERAAAAPWVPGQPLPPPGPLPRRAGCSLPDALLTLEAFSARVEGAAGGRGAEAVPLRDTAVSLPSATLVPSPFAARPLLCAYLRSLRASLVEDCRFARWCPSAPHCGRGALLGAPDGSHTSGGDGGAGGGGGGEADAHGEGEADADGAPTMPPPGSIPPVELRCPCSLEYCLSCGRRAHAPATCSMLRAWDMVWQSSGRSNDWVRENTVPCPRCGAAVNKDGGCNHVVCQCGQTFCFLCGKRTGDDHSYYEIKNHVCPALRAKRLETRTAGSSNAEADAERSPPKRGRGRHGKRGDDDKRAPGKGAGGKDRGAASSWSGPGSQVALADARLADGEGATAAAPATVQAAAPARRPPSALSEEARDARFQGYHERCEEQLALQRAAERVRKAGLVLGTLAGQAQGGAPGTLAGQAGAGATAADALGWAPTRSASGASTSSSAAGAVTALPLPSWLEGVVSTIVQTRRILAYAQVFACCAFDGATLVGPGLEPGSALEQLFEGRRRDLEAQANKLQGLAEAAMVEAATAARRELARERRASEPEAAAAETAETAAVSPAALASAAEDALAAARRELLDLAAATDAAACGLVDAARNDVAARAIKGDSRVAPYMGRGRVRVVDWTEEGGRE